MRSHLLAAALAVALSFGAAASKADTPALTVVNPSVSLNLGNLDMVIGWGFITTGETITALGYNNNNFNSSHKVGIYDGPSKTLLASVTVTGASILIDGYRYTSLAAPLVLVPGGYVIMGTTLGQDDGFIYDVQSYTTNAETMTSPLLTGLSGPGNGGNLSFPAMLTSSKYFADNFLVSTPVPEPRAWTLMALGIGAIGAARRLSRRTAATTLSTS